MKATDFEFRNRFWMIGAIFGIAFFSYSVDHVATVQAIADQLAGHDPAKADSFARMLLGIGSLFVGCAALIRTWATAYLRSDVVHDSELHSEALVADGPYRHVRNPLYLGNILMAIGMGLLAPRSGFVILVVGMTIFVLRLIGREEAQLEQEQGERFREFAGRVPRLWPSLVPRVPAGGLRPRWGQAFTGEIFFWAFFAAILIFTITLNNILFWILIVAGLASRIILGFVQSRGGKSTQAS